MVGHHLPGFHLGWPARRSPRCVPGLRYPLSPVLREPHGPVHPEQHLEKLQASFFSTPSFSATLSFLLHPARLFLFLMGTWDTNPTSRCKLSMGVSVEMCKRLVFFFSLQMATDFPELTDSVGMSTQPFVIFA